VPAASPAPPTPPVPLAPIDWSKSYYEVIGVTIEASRGVIHRAFLRLSKLYHPDKAGSEFTSDFQRLNHVHDILSSAATRREYDRDPTCFLFPGESVPLQPSSAPDGKSGKPTGKPTGKPSAAKVVKVLRDHIDIDSLEFFASLSAAAYIVLDDEMTCKETLRSRAYHWQTLIYFPVYIRFLYFINVDL
jgi:curved DNA-binding protein CbpA